MTMRPLVILHGVFGSSRNWQSVSRKLAELNPSKPIYPLDLRNHNCVNNPNAISGPIESWRTLQNDLEHYWRQSLNSCDFDLMGHSFVSSRYNIEAPNRFAGRIGCNELHT